MKASFTFDTPIAAGEIILVLAKGETCVTLVHDSGGNLFTQMDPHRTYASARESPAGLVVAVEYEGAEQDIEVVTVCAARDVRTGPRDIPGVARALLASEWIEVAILDARSYECPSCGGTKPHHEHGCAHDQGLIDYGYPTQDSRDRARVDLRQLRQ